MKEAIDLAGVRWDLPIHLVDAIFYHTKRYLCSCPMEDFLPAEAKLGQTARQVLDQICKTIDHGYQVHALQRNPHIVLLDNMWYDKFLKDKMALWAFLGIYKNIETDGKKVPVDVFLDYIRGGDKLQHKEILEANLYPESFKLLNLCCDWYGPSSSLPS